MSYKFKIGDKVRDKESNEIGTVIAHEQVKLEDKKVAIQYIVKFGDGFENYRPYTRKGLELVNTDEKPVIPAYPKTYSHTQKCKDGKRTIVMVGVIGKCRDYKFNYLNPLSNFSIKKKILSVGYAICHPDDENDFFVGLKLATKRAFEKPISYLETPFMGEFTEEFVNLILKNKADFIEKNLEKFINRDKK